MQRNGENFGELTKSQLLAVRPELFSYLIYSLAIDESGESHVSLQFKLTSDVGWLCTYICCIV